MSVSPSVCFFSEGHHSEQRDGMLQRGFSGGHNVVIKYSYDVEELTGKLDRIMRRQDASVLDC